jgi:hypothetical protein
MKVKLITGEILGVTKIEAHAYRDPGTGAVSYRTVVTLKDGRDVSLLSSQFEIIPNEWELNPMSRRVQHGRG